MEEALSFDDVMLLPQQSELASRSDADISSEVVPGLAISVPIISANMPSVTGPRLAKAMYSSGGYPVLHRFCSIDEAKVDFWEATEMDRAHILEVGVSIGIKDGIERMEHLVDAGVRVFFIDIAHADSLHVHDFLKRIEDAGLVGKDIVVGNIATRHATIDLLSKFPWIDGLKVGIGPGAACTTREVTGFGVPQWTAIKNVREAIDDMSINVKIIADGGCKNSGDIVKALAIGADTVMVGRLLAGCDEAPNPGIYYGSASAHVNGHNAPEGAYGEIEHSGSVEKVMKQLAWGIRSGVSYGGGRNLEELRQNAEWQRVSPLSAIESGVRF